MTHLTIGNTVTDAKTDSAVEIMGISKGWYTVKFADESTAKRRAKDLEEIEKPTGKLNQAQTLAKYRKDYRISICGGGRKSQASKLSAVADKWEGNDHGKVAQWSALLLGKPVLELYLKYAHLNNGQMRMSAGNMINARIKNETLTLEEMEAVMTEEITATAILDAEHRVGFLPKPLKTAIA